MISGRGAPSDRRSREIRRWLGYARATLLLLMVGDGMAANLARQAKAPLAAPLFFAGLGLLLLLALPDLVEFALVRLRVLAKAKPRKEAPAIEAIFEPPPIERKAYEDRKAEDCGARPSLLQIQGGDLPASLAHGARMSWYVPPAETDKPEH